MANKTFHIPKSAIVETEDNVSILKNEQQTITTDASAVATLTNTDGFKAAHYSIAAERDGEVTTTTETTTTTVTGSGGLDADTKLLLNANYIYDQSFSKKDITLNNTEVVRKGYAFDGSDDYISISDSTDLDIGTGDYTFESWFKTSSASRQRIFADYNDSNKGLYVDINSSKIFVFFGDGSNFAFSSDASATVTDGVWHHLAVVFDGTNCKVYIDGTLDHTISYTSSNAPGSLTTSLTLGRNSASAQYYFNGYLADIRISKGTARYTADFDELVTTKDDDHVLILTGETTDQSDSNQSLTFSGAHPTAKYGQGSFYFDGSDSLTVSDSDDFNFGTDDFTIELWFNNSRNSNSGGQTLIGQGQSGGGSNSSFLIWKNGDGSKIGFYVGSNWAYYIETTTNASTTNEWVHLAAVRSGDTLTLYMNGQSAGTTSLSTNYTMNNSAHDLSVGNFPGGTTSYFQGYMSDIRISKGVARYTAAFNDDLPTAPLETEDSRTKLLLNTNSALQDFEIGRMALAPTYAGDTTVVRRGYAFDGSDSISVAGSTDFNFGTDDFTIEFWLNPDNTTDWQALVASPNYYISGYNGNWVIDKNIGNLRMYSYDGTASEVSLIVTMSSSEWQHIAFVRNSGTLTCYINGVAAGSTSNFSSRSLSDGQNGIKLGTATSGPNNLNGYMSDIRITKGEAVYTSAFTPPESLSVGTNTKLLLSGAETDDYDSNRSLTFSGAHPTAKFGDGAYYLSGADNIALGPVNPIGTGDFTYEMWFYGTNLQTERGFLQLTNSTSGINAGYDGFAIYTKDYSAGSVNIRFFDVNSNLVSTSGRPVSENTWHHLAVSRQNGTVRIFIDGTQEASGTVTTDFDEEYLGLGAYYSFNDSGYDYSMQGYIDDFRVSSTALYTASFDVPTSELGSGSGTTTTTETTTTTTTGSSDVVLTKVHLVHDGSNVYFTEYGRTATDDDFLELSASYDAGVAKLHASTTSGSATLELTKKEFDFSAD